MASNGRQFNVPPMRPRHMRPHHGPPSSAPFHRPTPPSANFHRPRFGGMPNYATPPPKPRRDIFLPSSHGKEFLNQEKMFLPNSVDSLNENALCRQLIKHIPVVVEKTGAEIRLEGGSPSDEKLFFYVGHNNIVVFNQAKQLVIQMVQRVVTDMHNSYSSNRENDDDVVLIDAILEENSRNSLPSNELQQKQFLIQNAIANHKHFLQSEMDKVKDKQLIEADDERPSMMELLDSAVEDGPEVITLEDDRPPTAEELELKNQLEKLKKSASILKLAENIPNKPVGGRGMRIRQPQVFPQRPVEQYVLAPTRNVNQNNSANLNNYFQPNAAIVKEKQTKKSIQFNLGKLPPPPPPPPIISKKKNVVKLVPKDPVMKPADNTIKPTTESVAAEVAPKTTKKGQEPVTKKLDKDSVKAIPLPKEAKVKSISTSDALESASIDPALDHMYHPSVNATVSQSEVVDNVIEVDSQLKKISATDKLQVCYFSDNEYGEDPYSELLNDSSHSAANEKGKKSEKNQSKVVNDDPEIVSVDHSNKRHSYRGEGRGRMLRKSVDEYQERENHKQSYDEDFSYRRQSLEERAPSPEDPAVILERERKMKERERKNYERRERESDFIERKNRKARRVKLQKLLLSGRLDDLKSEREKWEKEELRRVEVWEQDKKYVPEEEVEKCEMREEDRRERFEKERSYWLKKEAEELKKQLSEELESSAKQNGKGPPVLYVLSISPNTTQSALFNHFVQFGPVNRVVLIRTRVKNVLQAEVYFDSWAHINRILNYHSSAHYLDGYHLQLSRDKLNITCPITRMDEFKVDKRKESFDEILLKYKMQTELKKGRTADNIISQKPARLLPLRRRTRTSADDAVVDLTSEADTVRIPNKWQPEPINKNFRNTELEMQLQKMRFAGITSDITEITPETTEEELPRKICLVLDPSMSYYDEETANQCRYPLLSATGLSNISSTKLIETHWSNTGKDLVYSQKDGSFLNQMLYIVMPSTNVLLEAAIGDNLQDNSLAKNLSKLSESNSPVMSEKLHLFMKSMRKNLNRVRRKDSSFNPLEMKALTSVISKAEENIESFITDLKEDLASIRVFKLMREKRIAALSADSIAIKEEKSIDFDLSITGENISIVFGEKVPEGGEKVDQTRPSGDCTLSAFIQFVGQQIKKVGRKDPITIDLEDGETSDSEQNKENENKKDDPAEVIRNLLIRRLLHETFVMHQMIHIKNKFKESKEDKSVAFTDFCVKWLDKNEIKRAINYAKTLKIIAEKSDVSLAVSSLFQFVKLYNCVARTSWLFASCSGPLMEGLQDALKEEGEVEEGEMEESVDRRKEERKKRRQQKREEKKRKEAERAEEEAKKMKEMEVLKSKLQQELASMGVEMEGDKFDKPPGEPQEEGELEQDGEGVSKSSNSGRHSTMDFLNILKNRPAESIPLPSQEEPFTPTPFAPPPALGLKSKKYPKAAPFSGPGKQSRVAELDNRGRFNNMGQDMTSAPMLPPNNVPQNMYTYPPMPNASPMQNFPPNSSPIPNFMPNSGPMQTSGSMPNSGTVLPMPVPSPFRPPEHQPPALISTCDPMPEGYNEEDAAAGIKTTAPAQSTLSSLKRVMNKQKKLSKEEIAAMIAKPKKTVEAPKATEEAIVPLAIEDQPNEDQSVDDQPVDDQSVVEKATLAPEESNDWFSAMQDMWSNSRNVVNVVCDEDGNEEYRNRGGYLMPGPTPSFVLGGQDEAYNQYRKFKKRKPRKRNVENELRKAAVSTELAPEDRIGPNAEQWRKDQEEYMKKLGGKRPREEEKEGEVEEENANKKAKEETTTKKAKLIPIPYKRYILDNDPFREFVYNYRSKLQEAKRKLGQLKKQNKKDCEDEENSLRAEINKYNLRKSKLDICSFVVRVSMSTSDFHVKWAHDLAHVFGMTYAPSRDGTTGAWLFSSNEGEDASSIVQVVKHIRLADCELHSSVHYAAATLPPIEDETKVVVRRRLKIFREKYDNTICRNMQEAIEAEDKCSFFRTDWRNAYLGELKGLYFTVANLVRSLARKQASGGKKWCSEGIRGVVVVLEESIAVWCGGLVGALAGKKGVSLVGGDDMGLSDVEQADIVVGTPEQLLPLLDKSEETQEDHLVRVLPEGTKKPKHLLSTVSAVVLDDVHSLVESPETHTLLKLIKEKSKKADSLEVVAVARRIRLDELESIEQSVGCKFPRTALEEPKVEEVATAEVEEILTTEPPVGEVNVPVEVKDQFPKVRGPLNKPSFNTFNKKNVNKANYRNNKAKDDNKKIEPVKRAREEEANEVQEENEPKKRLTFLEELELYKTNQKRRKLEEGTSMSDELVKKQKRDLEKKMAQLKEEQKKRLEDERRTAFEEKKKRREAEEEKRRFEEIEKKRKEQEEQKRKEVDTEKIKEVRRQVEEDEEVEKIQESNVDLSFSLKEREGEESVVKEALTNDSEEKMEVDEKNEESVEHRKETEEVGKETDNILPADKLSTEECEEITVIDTEEESRRRAMEGKEKMMREQLVKKLNLEKVGPPKLDDMVTHLNDQAVQLSERARKFNEKMKEDAKKKKEEASKKEESSSEKVKTKEGSSFEKKKSKKKKKDKKTSSDSENEKKKKLKQKKATKEKKKLSKSELLKLEQKKKLQEEKRKLEEQIKREILKRQQTLKSDEVLKEEKKRQQLQEKLLEQQLLLQNKLKKEKKRQKMMTRQGEAP